MHLGQTSWQDILQSGIHTAGSIWGRNGSATQADIDAALGVPAQPRYEVAWPTADYTPLLVAGGLGLALVLMMRGGRRR